MEMMAMFAAVAPHDQAPIAAGIAAVVSAVPVAVCGSSRICRPVAAVSIPAPMVTMIRPFAVVAIAETYLLVATVLSQPHAPAAGAVALVSD